MKNILKSLSVLIFLFAFMACDGGGSSISVSVDDVYPGDLASYTLNTATMSGDGQAELTGTSSAGDILSEDLGLILSDLTSIDLSTYTPGASPVSLGLSRSVSAPTEAELDALIADLMNGESVKETIKIVNETKSVSTITEADLDSGTFTMNAELTATAKASESASGVSFSAGLVADVSVVGTGLENNLGGIASVDDPIIDIPHMVLNAATNSSISGDITFDEFGDPTSGTVTVSSHTAVILGFSISDIDDGSLNQVPSGKYIYSIDVNESLSLDIATFEPTGSISATLFVKVYDNSNTLVAEWEYSGTDLDSL